MDTFDYLIKAIYKAYDKLSANEKALADSLLKSPSLIIIHTASQLAKTLGVSNSTVTRFIKRIGFDNFDHARQEARKRLREGSPLTLMDEQPPQLAKTTKGMLNEFLETEISVIKSTYATLDPNEVTEVCQRLVKAPIIAFLGFRNSHFFAAYAQWQFIQFHDDVRFLPHAGETIAERIADLKPGDIVFVVGVRRLLSDFKPYLQAVKETGADILLITDPSQQALSSLATWTFVCPVENDKAFDCYGGVLSLIRLFAFNSLVIAGEAGKQRMQKIEKIHEKLAELD